MLLQAFAKLIVPAILQVNHQPSHQHTYPSTDHLITSFIITSIITLRIYLIALLQAFVELVDPVVWLLLAHEARRGPPVERREGRRVEGIWPWSWPWSRPPWTWGWGIHGARGHTIHHWHVVHGVHVVHDDHKHRGVESGLVSRVGHQDWCAQSTLVCSHLQLSWRDMCVCILSHCLCIMASTRSCSKTCPAFTGDLRQSHRRFR